jgi:hypothetical protein
MAGRSLRWCTPVLIGLIVLIAAASARAGGDFVDLAIGHGRVWFTGPFGVRSLDAHSGRTRSMPRLVGAPYPLSVAMAGGAAWIASVENGYVWGTLSRIDERTGGVRVVWRKRGSSVQYVAAGAGSVWALIGSRRGARIARFTTAGRLLRIWRIPVAGRMAADSAGCWVSTGRWLLRIDPAGHVHRIVRAPLGDVATGDGAVWLPRAGSVLRVDERTGRRSILRTGRLGLGGFQHDLAVGRDALWALSSSGRTRSTLVRFDPSRGRRTGSVSVRGIGDAVVARPNGVWVATVVAPGGKSATDIAVARFDPRTLRRTLLVHLG